MRLESVVTEILLFASPVGNGLRFYQESVNPSAKNRFGGGICKQYSSILEGPRRQRLCISASAITGREPLRGPVVVTATSIGVSSFVELGSWRDLSQGTRSPASAINV